MNIANLLKYCPKGTTLYSLVDGEVTLESIRNTGQYHIEVVTNNGNTSYFTKDGKIFANRPNGECVLFPSKDQRDWSKFRLPLKRGDIMMKVDGTIPFIASGEFYKDTSPKYICGVDTTGHFSTGIYGWTSEFYIPASEEVKKELFSKIEEAGYKWNTDTLELEKIEPKFKEGDFIKNKQGTIYLVSEVIDYDVINLKAALAGTSELVIGLGTIQSFDDLSMATEEEKNKLLSALIRAGYKYDQEQHKLVKQKLKPFEKVLVRNSIFEPWKIDFYSTYIENKSYHYICASNDYKICIPYEGNEYLLGTSNPYIEKDNE